MTTVLCMNPVSIDCFHSTVHWCRNVYQESTLGWIPTAIQCHAIATVSALIRLYFLLAGASPPLFFVCGHLLLLFAQIHPLSTLWRSLDFLNFLFSLSLGTSEVRESPKARATGAMFLCHRKITETYIIGGLGTVFESGAPPKTVVVHRSGWDLHPINPLLDSVFVFWNGALRCQDRLQGCTLLLSACFQPLMSCLV